MSTLELAVSIGELRRELSALAHRVRQLETAPDPDPATTFIGAPA